MKRRLDLICCFVFVLVAFLMVIEKTQGQSGHNGWILRRPGPKGQRGTVENANTLYVDAGPNQSVTTTNFTLTGVATNLANPSEPLNVTWSIVSPNEAVSFFPVNALTTSVIVTNTADTTYQFKLLVNNDRYFAFDTVFVFKAATLVTNQPPSITPVPDQIVLENTATNVHWIWSDDTTAVAAATYVISSSNTNLVPNVNLVLDGTKTNLSITPLTHSNGVSIISITPIDSSLLPGLTRQFAFNVLATNDPPTISNPGPQSTLQNTPKVVNFTVGDIETPPGNLVPSASSSDLTKVLNSGLVLGGSGANRTLTFTPINNAFGVLNITIRASDGQIVTPATFALTITHVNQPPTLAAIPDTTTLQDTPVTFSIDAQDIDSTLTLASFSCTASSNPTLIGTGNVTFGGSLGAWTLTASPLAGQTGDGTITVQVSDGSLTASRSFVLHVVSSVFTLPTDRAVDWSLAGIPGGIPVVSSQFCNIKQSIPGSALVAHGDGSTDDSAAIAAALALCPSNKFIFAPAGTYINNAATTVMRNGVVLRGEGMSRTRFITKPIYMGPINYGVKMVDMYGTVLAKGASNVLTKTTALTGSDSPGLIPAVGMFLAIGVTNDNVLVDPVGTGGDWSDVPPGFHKKNLAQMAVITAVSSQTNITFWPPSVWNYSNSLGVVVRFYSTLTARVGIEDITLESPLPHTQQSMVLCNAAAYCWLKNVKVNWAYEDAVYIKEAFRCNFEGCWPQYTLHGTSSGGYGFRFESEPSWNLVQDNIIEGFRDPIIFSGGSANVAAYNYAPWATNSDLFTQHALSFHACSPVFNLFEGNETWSGGADDTHGSSIYNTYFRNYLTGTNYQGSTPGGGGSTGYNWVMRLDRKALFFSALGNVFGVPGQAGVYESSSAIGGGTRSLNTRYIWTLGYVDDGSGSTAPSGGFNYDTNVRLTLLRKQNWDYINNGIDDPVNIQNSLYLAAKPSWFGSLAWPPIGPDITGKTNSTPAKVRYLARVSPSFTVTDKTGAVNAVISWPLTVTAQDEFWDVTFLSSNAGLITTGNIVVTGVGATRTVTMTPNGGASGSSTITVTVTGQRLTTSHTFVYTVQAGNIPPTISSIPNQSIAKNTSSAALAFTISDADTPVGSLVVGKNSSNPSLILSSGIAIGGSGGSRTATLTPVSGQIGSATISLTVNDGTTTVGTSFVLTVTNTGFNTWYAKPPKKPDDPTLYSGSVYVSQGSGTASDPWDLFTACNSSLVQPGDHIELYGEGSAFSNNGVYSNVFQFHRSGSDDNNPVIYEAFNHQHVVLDGFDHHLCQGEHQGNDQPDGIVALMMGHYIWLKNIEIKATPITRLSTNQDGSIDLSFPPDIVYPGLYDAGESPSLDGVGCRVIESYLHDGQSGVSIFDNANNVEIYGCVIAYIGLDEFDRAHGPGLYGRSKDPIGNRILNSVSAAQFSQNWQIFGKAGGVVVKNLQFEGNVCFNGGELGAGKALPFYNTHGQFTTGLGMYTLSDTVFDSLIQSNIFYYPVASDSPSFNLGGSLDGGNGATRCTNRFNWMVSRIKFDKNPGPNVFSSNWVYYSNLQNFTTSDFPNNFYFTSRPSQSHLIHRKVDKYSPKRGHVYFMRWGNEAQVQVDPSQLGYLVGDPIKIYSLTDVRRGHSLFSGTWIGGVIPITISSITVAPIIGANAGRQPSNPSIDLVCLVVSPTEPF